MAQENGLYADPFTTLGSMATALPAAGQFNLYATEHNALATTGAQFYPQHGAFPTGPLQPPNYHLYQPFDTYRQELQPWQRATYDFFMPAKMREELQKKMFATQQVMPSELRQNSASFSAPSFADPNRLGLTPTRTLALAVPARHKQQEEHVLLWLPELGVQGPEQPDWQALRPQET